MLGDEPRGPLCQSCGMPFSSRMDLGTDATGHPVADYSRFYFVDGAFTEPGISMQGMIDRCVDVTAQRGLLSRAEAQACMTQLLPTLERWRPAASHVLGIG
jgi:hypothetical protein